MTDRPIIFSAPMIRALLDGRKTQTRRVLKVQPDTTSDPSGMGRWGAVNRLGYWHPAAEARPYAPGDRLWVREAWQQWPPENVRAEEKRPLIYRATDGEPPASEVPDWAHHWRDASGSMKFRWCSALHMPRWASRLTLTVTDVRVQRLQEISAEDVQAEGVAELAFIPATAEDTAEARDAFRKVWNSLHGHDAWDANPWVAAVSFTVQRRNIDA